MGAQRVTRLEEANAVAQEDFDEVWVLRVGVLGR